ncbi:MAG: class II aldolase/adducin family protein, partial [Clostridia bacterium]|nr:class II aldolase/adducin family protein [Clostridia bacterium]
LEELVRISTGPGGRADYVQGGGGNTSCKLDGRLMAVKASGFRLGQITVREAYSVLDYASLRSFFQAGTGEDTPEIEQAGGNAVREAGVPIDGMTPLRPSVEAGFHALLGRCVLHTHSVYANTVCCSGDPERLAEEAMKTLDVPWGMVPYIDPGTRLTFAVASECERVRKRTGSDPSVLFLRNHGLIVTNGDAAGCMDLHDAVNRRLAAVAGTGFDEWPSIAVRPDGSGGYRSPTPWLRHRLAGMADPVGRFTADPLYPDQMVYLAGKIGRAEDRAAGLVCRIDTLNGEVSYTCGENEALTIEETLCAVLFILESQERNRWATCAMNASARMFIAGWESEAYRRSVSAGGGGTEAVR